MRQFLVIATAAALLAPTLATSAEPAPAPLRMPGLWLLSTQITGASERAPDYHYCVVADEDAPLLNPVVDLGSCEQVQWRGDWLRRTVEASCTDTEGSLRLEGRFEGDFQYSYQGVVTLHYEPARQGVETLRLNYEGRRVAPCKEHIPRGVFLIEGVDGVGNLNLSQ
ncbi:DUF3617 domain-containing protein [Azoarcus taiwanensis]|uniref:Uncharacterized protein n=1 Tax=Azoarcus taiwanensis TaxID=666964 RepID=A0A972FFW1_9RHOO|nr:DUF3617 family protein [Azoarcus taiwanensis]NMG04833.1 hypothetical protein [Azoarcus taiwanensis]